MDQKWDNDEGGDEEENVDNVDCDDDVKDDLDDHVDDIWPDCRVEMSTRYGDKDEKCEDNDDNVMMW